jgi:hypothetical protein
MTPVTVRRAVVSVQRESVRRLELARQLTPARGCYCREVVEPHIVGHVLVEVIPRAWQLPTSFQDKRIR